MTPATITISDLRLYGHHGVGEQERRVGAWFVYRIELHYDATAAIATDCLEHAINYAEAVEIVRLVQAEPSRLLEHLAGRIRTALVAAFPPLTAGSVSVTKLSPPYSHPAPATLTINW